MIEQFREWAIEVTENSLLCETKERDTELATQIVGNVLALRGNIIDGKFVPDKAGRYRLAIVDEGAELPTQNNECILWGLYRKGWLDSQQEMGLAGYRKVVEEKGERDERATNNL